MPKAARLKTSLPTYNGIGALDVRPGSNTVYALTSTNALGQALRAEVEVDLRYGHGGRTVAGAVTPVVVRLKSLGERDRVGRHARNLATVETDVTLTAPSGRSE